MALTRKQRRGTLIATGALILAFAVGLVLFAFEDAIVFFYTPSEVAEKKIAPGQRFRLGGLVAKDSIDRSQGSVIRFSVTDTVDTLKVVYEGVLPDLFREEQGVVTEGKLDANGIFVADTVLAKHDENYMPKEVADALKEKGLWQHEK